jgi:hypothetical protein
MKIKASVKSLYRFSLESETMSAMAFRHDLRKACDNLPTGGRVVISNIPAHMNGQGDLRVGVGGKYSLFLKPVQSGRLTIEDYVAWLEEVGFTNIVMGPHPYSLSILVAVK